jgi:hypothetical protein
MDELLPVDLADEPSPLSVCEVCRSPELREDFWVAFRVRVCESCLRADGSRGQTYGLITKSEAQVSYLHNFKCMSMTHIFPSKLQATYLLHDIDLDPKAGGLGFLMKVNPQHQLFSSMKLFLEAQVRALSYSRHGGADGLAAETRRRKAKAQEAKAARRLAQDSALSAPAEGRKRRAQTSSRHIDVAAAIRAAIESAHVCNFQPARASSAASQPSRAQGALEQVRVMECVCGASYELTILVPRAVTVVID